MAEKRRRRSGKRTDADLCRAKNWQPGQIIRCQGHFERFAHFYRLTAVGERSILWEMVHYEGDWSHRESQSTYSLHQYAMTAVTLDEAVEELNRRFVRRGQQN